MKVIALVTLLATGVSVFAQEGAHPIELPPISLSEAAAIPLREPGPRVYEHPLLPRLRFGVRAASTIGPAPTATITAPPITTLFNSDASRNFVPADSAGAVGPAHIVSTNNARIVVHDRAGKVLKSVLQDQFWSMAPGALPAGEYYDPRAEYDPGADRWVLMTIHDERAIAFAVSESGDPTGVWRRYMLEAPGADFSMLAITGERIILGTTYGEFTNTLLCSMRKQDLYTHAASIDTRLFHLNTPFALPVSSESTHQYVVATEGGESLQVIDLNDLGEVDAIEPSSWSIAPFRLLPQAGGDGLDGGYGVLDDADERDGWIYATMARDTTIAGRQSVTWARINAETGEAQWGAIADPMDKTLYAYPSLAVNRYGEMVIAFGIFSATGYVSSGYVYRDFLGRISTVTPIRTGTTPVTVHERWGDYTTTVVDPVDRTSFWTVQIHATNGSWGTSWAKIAATAPLTPKRRAARH